MKVAEERWGVGAVAGWAHGAVTPFHPDFRAGFDPGLPRLR